MKHLKKFNASSASQLIYEESEQPLTSVREIHHILDDIRQDFEFSDKGNDEMITFATFLLDNTNEAVISILQNIKKGYTNDGFGVYTTDPKKYPKMLAEIEKKVGRKF